MNNDLPAAMTAIQIFLLVSLGLPVGYILLFSVAGLFYRQVPLNKKTGNRKIAVLIPGYREDGVILEAARSALSQDYPDGSYEVIVIADSFLPETIARLKEMPVRVIEVSFEKSTKSKALNRALELLPYSYEIAVVLDADNIMEKDFLSLINSVFDNDIYAVQGHRTAKNMNTPLAILDAASEEINNHIFRKGHRVLGLSSAIIGSGMAFRYGFFKSLMSTVTAVGGFDKEIELKMLREGHLIEYLDNALVYDEKVQKAEAFSNQRRRWLSAQLHYFRKDFFTAIKELVSKGNIDYFDKAIQFIQPPRVLLLGAAGLAGALFILCDLLIFRNMTFAIMWCTLVILCLASFICSLPRSFYNMKTVSALASLPKGMILMLGSLLRIRGANKSFIHTSHTVAEVDKKAV